MLSSSRFSKSLGSLISVASRRSTLSKPTSPAIELCPIQEEPSGDGDCDGDGDGDGEGGAVDSKTMESIAVGQGGFVGSGDNDIELGHS